VGEVWWETWPDRMYDPAPWLQGDVFDAVMNYRWYAPTRSFFAGTDQRLGPAAYAVAIDSLGNGIAPPHRKAMMNLTASHDTPRFSTSVYNPGRFKYHNNPREDPDYRIDRPDERARRTQQLILAQQFTYIGAPHIWNGDEVGMWGADDPDERKPLVWADLRYEDEVTHPFGRPRRRDPVRPDTAMFRVYQELIALRKRHLRLFVDGSLGWLRTGSAGVLAYERVLGDERAVVAFNTSETPVEFTVPGEGEFRVAYPADAGVSKDTGLLTTRLPGREARVWIRE
jgi:cyclomaltodextrinase / maltogenic alpha-amylase / neopullulanase